MINCGEVWLVVGCALCVSSCTSEADLGAVSFAVRDSAGVSIVENFLPEDLPTCALGGPRITIGEASGNEENELYRVFGARRLSDGRIVLVNQGSQELRYFGRDGKFLGRAGRSGEGPGEFRDAFYLWVTAEDTVWVGDYRPWQFHVFSPEGAWVRTVRPSPTLGNPPVLMTVLSDGRAVLAAQDVSSFGENFAPSLVTALLYAPNGEVEDTVGTFSNGHLGRVGDNDETPFVYPLFESFVRLDGAGDRWYLGHGSEPEVSVFTATPAATLQIQVRWTTQDLTIRRKDVDSERARIESRYSDLGQAEARRRAAHLVSDERPVADRFPAFGSIVANRSGGFWVREYPRPDDPPPARWLSFDSQGRFECRITMPAVEIVDLGADYILVKQYSELGVEQIAMFEVGAPGT